MRSLSLSFFVVALMLAPLRAAERDVVRSFPAAKGCSLNIDTFRGSITVTEADTDAVRVAVHVEIGADDEREAEQMMANLQLQLSQEGPLITVRARDPQQARPRFIWNDKKQVEPVFRVTLPAACNLTLRTRIGSIVVGNVTGALRAETDTGDVFFRRVSGQVEARTAKGDVVISHCVGTLRAMTSLGVVRLGVVTGRCDVENRSGDVEILDARSDLRVRAEAGSISVGLPRGFSGLADVATNGGSIIASIDPTADCDVAASASLLARVESALPLQITSGHVGGRRLAGRLNHGGARVELHASGGNVRLMPTPPPL